jgi:hypothetical protein
MADEHDSWFKPFGFDPGEFAANALNQAGSAISGVVQSVGTALEDAANTVSTAVGLPPIAPGGAPAPKTGSNGSGGGGGGGGTVSTLGGSVGAGGVNNPIDVKAVQKALGIGDDGQCGGGTIEAIKNFQRSIGMANPDGRIDPGGKTSRALAGGASAPSLRNDSGGSDPPPTDRPGAEPGPPTERESPPTDRPGAPPGPPTERRPGPGFPPMPMPFGDPQLPQLPPGVDKDALIKALKVLGISMTLLPLIIAALAVPNPVAKLALLGLTVVQINALLKALGMKGIEVPGREPECCAICPKENLDFCLLRAGHEGQHYCGRHSW